MKNINTIRSIEAEGFHHGTQEVEPTAALEEINRHFAQLKEQEKIATSDRIKSLEGNIENTEQRKFDTDRHWVDLEMQTAGMPPPILLPLCAVIFSGLVVIGETIFLAPVMDGFGITDLVWQHLLAGVIVIVFSGLLEITKQQWQQLHENEHSQLEGEKIAANSRWPKMIFLGFINLLALLFVSVLGWWRAQEMIFAASSHPGEWQTFLSDNAMLTRMVVLLLTVSLPVFVAIAFDWGISGLRFGMEWRKTRRAYKQYTSELATVRKQLEGEEEKTRSRQQILDDMNEEWRQSYLQNHELGQKIGAQQLPLWQVVLKIVAVVLLLFVACLLVEPLISTYITSDGMRYLLYACLVFGLGGAYAAFCIRVWERPNSKQLYLQKAVNWRREGGEKGRLPDREIKGVFNMGGVEEGVSRS